MADPWTDDFAALGELTATQLPSEAATRARSIQEPQMRHRSKFIKVFAIIALLCIAPLAYAVGGRVLISIDPNKSGPEIEHDLQQQLNAAGVEATVHADKSDDGKLRVGIEATRSAAGPDIEIVPPPGAIADQRRVEVKVKVTTELSVDQKHALRDALQLVEHDPGDQTDDELAAALEAELTSRGFVATVEVHGGAVTVTVTGTSAR